MNRHQSINLRQLCLGYFLYSIGIKILTLPSALATGSGNFAWITAIVGSLFEIITVVLATMILRHCHQRPRGFRILCWFLLPLIAGEIWLCATEIYHMAYTDLFTDLSVVIFVITLILLGLFFIMCKPRAVFRSGEILWLLVALGLIIAVAPTFYKAAVDWRTLGQGNWSTILPTVGKNLCFFESASFILAFGSETQKTDRDIGKINLTAILCGIGYVALMIWFVLLFGPLAHTKSMGLVEFTSSAQFLTTTGSLDWLIAIAILSALILRFGVQLVALVTLIKRGLGRHD